MKFLVRVAAAAALISWNPLHAQEAVRLGTSSVGSVFYTIAVGLGEVVHKHSGVNVTVEPVGGSAANIFALGAKKIEFAMSNGFAAYTGYTGTYAFKEPVDIRLVMQGASNYRGLIVRKGAGIKSAKDLNGKTIIAKRRALPELEIIMDAVIKHFGLDKSSMNIVATTDTPEVINAFRAGSVDAAIVPFSLRAAQIGEPMRDGVIEFLPLSREDRDAILKLLPASFYGFTQPANLYQNQPHEAQLFALNTYFVTRPDVSEKVVYEIAKALMDHPAEVGTYHAAARAFTAQNAVKAPALPFHPGAVRYFKEKGLWTPELQEIQNRLLKQ